MFLRHCVDIIELQRCNEMRLNIQISSHNFTRALLVEYPTDWVRLCSYQAPLTIPSSLRPVRGSIPQPHARQETVHGSHIKPSASATLAKT